MLLTLAPKPYEGKGCVTCLITGTRFEPDRSALWLESESTLLAGYVCPGVARMTDLEISLALSKRGREMADLCHAYLSSSYEYVRREL